MRTHLVSPEAIPIDNERLRQAGREQLKHVAGTLEVILCHLQLALQRAPEDRILRDYLECSISLIDVSQQTVVQCIHWSAAISETVTSASRKAQGA